MNDGEPEAPSGIGWLRVVVWLMPTALFIGISWVIGFILVWIHPGVVLAVFVVLTGCLAYFDALLYCQQMRISPGDVRSKKILRACVFMVGQFALAPFAVIAVMGSSLA